MKQAKLNKTHQPKQELPTFRYKMDKSKLTYSFDDAILKNLFNNETFVMTNHNISLNCSQL